MAEVFLNVEPGTTVSITSRGQHVATVEAPVERESPDGRLVGGPRWYEETVGFGIHARRSWGWFANGSHAGVRHNYLSWLLLHNGKTSDVKLRAFALLIRHYEGVAPGYKGELADGV